MPFLLVPSPSFLAMLNITLECLDSAEAIGAFCISGITQQHGFRTSVHIRNVNNCSSHRHSIDVSPAKEDDDGYNSELEQSQLESLWAQPKYDHLGLACNPYESAWNRIGGVHL